MADMMKKVPVREQEPKVRATNFEEVCLGYNKEEAMEEATRCLNCKNARCIQGCPVSINIPAFIQEVKAGNIEEAYKVIGKSSALPAICGRVCPQESQCEGKCVRGIKGEAVSIGKLERFVADYALEHDIKPECAETKNGHKVAVIGSGAGLPMFMGIPGEASNGVFSANEYLTRSNLMKAFREDYDTPIAAGKKVAVVGGGNVAMDAARTALRLGAEVHIVYRRSEAELPARAEEVHHAKEEGIIFDLLTNPKKINVDEKGNITSMTVVKMELGEPDASGRRRPVEIEGSEYDIEVDTVIMSLGTSPNPLISSTTKGLETNRRKCIVAEEENGQTSKEGVFAGGDAVTGAATVILAMGAGKAGAKGIDEYLKNK